MVEGNNQEEGVIEQNGEHENMFTFLENGDQIILDE